MNWELVKWVVGVLLTFAAIKFVWTAFRSLFNKETMEDVLDTMGDKISDASHTINKKLKKKAMERRVQKAEKKNKPVVIIR